MKVNDFVNDSIHEVKRWYESFCDEPNQNRKIVVMQNILNTIESVRQVNDSFRILYNNGLLSGKTLAKYDIEIQVFFSEIYKIHVEVLNYKKLLTNNK